MSINLYSSPSKIYPNVAQLYQKNPIAFSVLMKAEHGEFTNPTSEVLQTISQSIFNEPLVEKTQQHAQWQNFKSRLVSWQDPLIWVQFCVFQKEGNFELVHLDLIENNQSLSQTWSELKKR